MNTYIVYVHINKANGKRYYGITGENNPNRRWKNGKGYNHNEDFTKDIKLYGWDNFEHIVIAKGLSKAEAKWLEIELIREWDTTNIDKGYNITKGGNIPTEEARKKMSKSAKDKNNSMYGITRENHPMAIKVYCVELDKYFYTITEASEYVGCNVSNISKVLNGNQKTAKGYHWVYAEDVEKLDIENNKVS